MTKDKSLLQFNFEGNDYSIRASGHAIERMKQRDITAFQVASAVFGLTLETLDELKDSGKDLAIIVEDENYSVVICRYRNTIKVITVIDKSDIWVKEGTEVFKYKN